MANAQIGPVVAQLHRLFVERQMQELSDQQLLQFFAQDRNEDAFAALVERHGRLVMGVCRHVLHHAQDAEDAFQATFLVLACKARSIRKQEALASWLHGVAYRMALKAKRDATRRRVQTGLSEAAAIPAAIEPTWREVQAILDAELERLPEKYRTAFILCCLENLGRAEAARQLGIKEGTLSSRLAVAKSRLQTRLRLRGVTLNAVLAGTVLSASAASAALVKSTAKSAGLYAGGSVTAGIVSAHVAQLAQGALNTMFLTKVKTGVYILLALALMTFGTGLGMRGGAGVDDAWADDPGKPAPPDAPAPGIFRDVTAQSGIDFTYHNGEEAGECTVLESLGGGVAVLDYDGDGLLDLFIPGGGYFDGPNKQEIKGYPCKLYKNLGNGKFKDVTKEVGLDVPMFYTHGAAVVDYDCDGWPDLLVTGWGRLALYHNESDGKGGRRFVDVTAKAGLPSGLWTTSAAFADLDGDGFPDLYLCQYLDWSFRNHPPCSYDGKNRDICPPKQFQPLPHKLFRNNRDGTFTDVTQEAGIQPSKGLGVVIADLNDDGKPDIFVANDTTGNLLYRNQCARGKFHFVEIGIQAGVARDWRGVPNGSKGIAIGDFDGSGKPSLLVTNYEREANALYRNQGAWIFRFDSRRAGISAIDQSCVGWGATFFDCDQDGMLDLFIANGHVLKHPTAPASRRQRPVLLRNRGDGMFEDITPQGGIYFQTDHNARGVAIVDINNDGRTALVIGHVNEPVVILITQPPSQNHWIGFELIGKNRRDVVGAKVVVETDQRTQTSFSHSGGSYASSSDRRHLFGLGPMEKVKRIRVTWPGGEKQQWDGLAADRYWRLTEGAGAEESPRSR
ncbi:MAG TPA: sigma-70 family RNA polymerase sigma factor [Gemmataceae bacterium]|nr:sigma-70 family RNA polymerase sigma factor [Gemmataceae bacterium]